MRPYRRNSWACISAADSGCYRAAAAVAESSNDHLREDSRMSKPVAQSWDLLGRAVPELPPAPPPDEEWSFARSPTNATAWVYRGTRNTRLVRPVILADGFRLGPSNLDELWFGVNGLFPFAKELGDRGQDLILLGYEERSA